MHKLDVVNEHVTYLSSSSDAIELPALDDMTAVSWIRSKEGALKKYTVNDTIIETTLLLALAEF